MKLLIVDDASGYAAPFPGYQVYIIGPPFDFEVNLDPLGNTLPKDQFTEETRCQNKLWSGQLPMSAPLPLPVKVIKQYWSLPKRNGQ